MKRRQFLKLLGLGSVALTFPAAVAPKRGLLLQESPLAGFQFYKGADVWPMLGVGQPLTLRRRRDNPYDERAVEVWWHSYMLGHLPRLENAAISRLLDRGERLSVHITALKESQDPWQRLWMAIEMEV